MRFMVSYFYQVRFFTPDMIPFSTALWDPKWFHDAKGNGYSFVDKNGVINGLRAEFLSPVNVQQSHMCPCDERHPDECMFLRDYMDSLRRYDFNDMLRYFDDYAKYLGIDDPTVVLLVYETPDNPCSERRMLQAWFEENGASLPEFNRKENL